MSRLIDRMKIFFVVVFALSCVAIWAYHLMWVWPSKRCEAKGWWWDGGHRICAMPVPISSITGRIPHTSIYATKPNPDAQ